MPSWARVATLPGAAATPRRRLPVPSGCSSWGRTRPGTSSPGDRPAPRRATPGPTTGSAASPPPTCPAPAAPRSATSRCSRSSAGCPRNRAGPPSRSATTTRAPDPAGTEPRLGNGFSRLGSRPTSAPAWRPTRVPGRSGRARLLVKAAGQPGPVPRTGPGSDSPDARVAVSATSGHFCGAATNLPRPRGHLRFGTGRSGGPEHVGKISGPPLSACPAPVRFGHLQADRRCAPGSGSRSSTSRAPTQPRCRRPGLVVATVAGRGGGRLGPGAGTGAQCGGSRRSAPSSTPPCAGSC